MTDLNKLFGSFRNFEKTKIRINPIHDLSIIALAERRNALTHKVNPEWKEGLTSGGALKARYLLIELVEEKDFLAREEKTSYLIRISREGGLSHLGIAGLTSRELEHKVPGCITTLSQSHHNEPATIAVIQELVKKDYKRTREYACIVGGGFLKIDSDSKQITAYGRSRAFTISYRHQREYYLGMTGHEMVQKVLAEELSNWTIKVINDEVETSDVQIPEPTK